MDAEEEKKSRDILKWILGQYTRARRRKKELDERLRRLNEEKENPLSGHGYDAMPHGTPSNDGAASILFKISDVEEKILQQQVTIEKAVVRVMDILDVLPENSEEREIAELFNIDNKSWDEIAEIVHKSKSQLHRDYNDACDIMLMNERVQRIISEQEGAYLTWTVKAETLRLKKLGRI